jgi:hypothetical protein
LKLLFSAHETIPVILINSLARQQGDQIAQIFASWAVVNFGRFLGNYKLN